MADFTWTYLSILQQGQIPFMLLALGMFGAMLHMQLVRRRRPATWLVMLNHGVLLQFAIMLLAWSLVATLGERAYFYIIFDFFLLTWTSLPFLLMGCLVPLLARKESRIR